MKLKLIVLLIFLMPKDIWSLTYLYSNNTQSNMYSNLKELFNKHTVSFIETDNINKDDNLYVIFDACNIAAKKLPKHYIVFQTLNIPKIGLTKEYLNILSNAIAVWDNKWENIKKYDESVHNHYYFPENYECAQACLLPCQLPVNALSTYKSLLSYSNARNTDISNFLPIIFAYTISAKPKNILELGVRSAESTIAFSKAAALIDAKLIGVDLDVNIPENYRALNNASYFSMNDLEFPNFYIWDKQFPKEKFDIIFIDTSHVYQHTMDEIRAFLPLLSDNGMLMFHDSHMSPLENDLYMRLNNTYDGSGWNNQKGVNRAIKDSFSIVFDEDKYNNFIFKYNKSSWELFHYPFCNGLTVIKRIIK
ncbi:MAG: class I SAM-dependent methyltransferase [Candidatus Babeliales bacterium]|nr:class I SAM-dependent methyltransferase [Candidatus Babeliales bacterium]